MNGKTEKVLEIYKDSKIQWDDGHKKYLFYNGEYDALIDLSAVSHELFVIARVGSIPPWEIDHEHPKIIKICKRLNFLNSL